MIWRVGDGCNLNIWKDPWILRDFSRKPITPRDATLITRVSKLIDPVVSGWEYELVNEIFWPEDAELILALPVHEGKVPWPGTSTSTAISYPIPCRVAFFAFLDSCSSVKVRTKSRHVPVHHPTALLQHVQHPIYF
jgi:hypothetical protein